MKVLFTKTGYEKLKEKELSLKESRKDAVADLKRAREMGDLSENGYYKAAKFKLGSIDREIRRVTYLIKYGKVADAPKKGVVSIGSIVTLDSGKVLRDYEIVGDQEADPSEGKISHLSPLGKQLVGKGSGDKIEVEAPSGKIQYKIKGVK